MAGADRVREIFDGALDRTGVARQAFLDSACAGDASLRAKVETLLAAAESEDTFLSKPTAGVGAAAAATTMLASLHEGPGMRIGPYKLLQLIGEGGFGSVFMAEQERPVVRKVALKIIKLGMDTRQVVARFEQERQALALMDHPHIAKVLDAGATETGRPYFVMELCKGDAVTEYCDKNNLSIPDRLELFAQVCQAVQHAHQKGLIHRDIKPGNILVSTQDGRPHAKVIDFGIAKATASKLTEKTLFTEHRQLIGTPQYMSPEQAEGSLDIDTRTDVYSLGVLLYELLTGTTPFDAKSLRSAAYGEIQRIIREVEPPKPSTRLIANAETIASVAAKRQTEPRRLGMIIRGELDWIVMKALEKDRQRRYETANGLAMDVRRYLSGEAILAAPPSTAYRLKKFVRRNRGVVASGTIVVASLVLGLAGTAWQAKRASDQRLAAEAERNKARKVADFMSETLQGAGPSIAKGRDTTMLKEMMDRAAARIENGELRTAPEAELSLRSTIGYTYFQLALFPQSNKMLEPALALARALHAGDHAETGNALNDLATLRKAEGNLAAAEALFREALAMHRRLFPGDHQAVAATLDNLAQLLQEMDKLEAAEPLSRESLAMHQRLAHGDDLDVAMSLYNLGYLLQQRGDTAGAEPLLRAALAMNKRLIKGDDPTVVNSLNNLAILLLNTNDLAGAEPLFREALEMTKRLLGGADHPDIARGYSNLAQLLMARGDLAGAEPLMRDALGMIRRLFPRDHPNVATALNNYAGLLLLRGDAAGAEPLARESAGMFERLTGADSTSTATARLKLARALIGLGRFAEAETEIMRAERVLATAEGVPPERRKQCIEAIVAMYEAWAKTEPSKGYETKAAEWKAKLNAVLSTPDKE